MDRAKTVRCSCLLNQLTLRRTMILCSIETQYCAPFSIVNTFLFKPPAPYVYTFPNEVIQLRTSHGTRICVTFIRRPGAALYLLLSHGNAEDLNTAYGFMQRLSLSLDVNIVGYDYSGYGCSSGFPSEKNCYADILCVFEYLTQVLHIDPSRVVLYGRSLGSGPSCYLAQKTQSEGQPVAGLILHAGFASVFRVVMPDFFGITLFGDCFPNIDRVRSIQCPVFIAHGEKDVVVPFNHAIALFDALPRPEKAHFFRSAAMHHNFFESGHEEQLFIKTLNQFLDDHVLQRCMQIENRMEVESEEEWQEPRTPVLHADL